MKRFSVIVPMALLTCGPDGGASVDLLFVQAPAAATCTYTPDSPTGDAFGFYDPAGSDGIFLGITMENYMAPPSEDETACPGGCGTLANNATVSGFEVCWFRQEDDALADCDDVPNSQKRVIAGAGSAPAGLRGVAFVTALTHNDLRGLYSDDFDPGTIPHLGAYTLDTNRSGGIDLEDAVFFSFGAEDPVAPRSASWGDFPEESSDIVVLKLRAQLTVPTGDTLITNWLTYPVNVCPRCAFAGCGDMQQIQCAERCNTLPCPANDPSGGNPPIDAHCLINTPNQCASHCDAAGTIECRPYDFLGPVINLGTCLPFQGYSPPNCTPVNRCEPV